MTIYLLLSLVPGLRGAIAYALALNLADQGEAFGSPKVISVLDTTTLIIVLFTILVCGGSTLPILKVSFILTFPTVYMYNIDVYVITVHTAMLFIEILKLVVQQSLCVYA